MDIFVYMFGILRSFEGKIRNLKLTKLGMGYPKI
jgi:hypothetical protein